MYICWQGKRGAGLFLIYRFYGKILGGKCIDNVVQLQENSL